VFCHSEAVSPARYTSDPPLEDASALAAPAFFCSFSAATAMLKGVNSVRR
jgi:hypothetical protein